MIWSTIELFTICKSGLYIYIQIKLLGSDELSSKSSHFDCGRQGVEITKYEQ